MKAETTPLHSQPYLHVRLTPGEVKALLRERGLEVGPRTRVILTVDYWSNDDYRDTEPSK